MKRFILIGIVVVLLIASTVLGYTLYTNVTKVLDTDRIYKGIYVEGVHLGGLTTEEALELLKKTYFEPLQNKKVEVIVEDKSYFLEYSSLGIKMDIDKAVEKAYSIGRKGNFATRFKEIKKVYENPVVIRLNFEYDENKLKKFVDELFNTYYQSPVNASIKKVGDQFVITPERIGKKLDYGYLLNKLKDIIKNKQEGKVYVRFLRITPRITASELSKVKEIIGSFTTKFDSSNVARSENIRVAAQKINGSLVMPGEIFSLSKVIGPVTVENGFKIAKVIVNNEFVDGVGGGLCQIATTMYNAVLMAQLKVVERAPHSALISYVPPGRDATIASGSIDFKFKNTTNAPIYVESYTSKNTVTVNLYGKNNHKAEIVKFESEIIERVPYKKVYKNDPTLPQGVEKLSNKPQNGLKVKTYMLVYKDGRLIERKLLSYDYYKPVNAVILVGTKAKETVSSSVYE
ncbi:vancomycin resistance protein YoaR [Caldicellulosiruptor bescii]|uniref:VanW family protein n=2 Tax=Caldicellulosiruptor bescii TaxID=31899 RepID=B9MR96_CALBD|nr:VanW family protein [Caldicellulosiruptor bescii]ACM60200.1 VanW family protein [Caldicellulosiruptor bescii DSM 6725]PBC87615.1 vancomycin resistance protein YoaR [Caldicellulosiruptor bescii]PBC90548.1 vancomycin resistance protein YoaR [Caldicellulosiruptor bescii]PBD04020.1 vancomycin resistance protein YoaR [Caldicellulosiruptor bescii]PBD06345.1 vancomycin resistance protein YoaR [Caldicellulosiruptor bescii]